MRLDADTNSAERKPCDGDLIRESASPGTHFFVGNLSLSERFVMAANSNISFTFVPACSHDFPPPVPVRHQARAPGQAI